VAGAVGLGAWVDLPQRQAPGLQPQRRLPLLDGAMALEAARGLVEHDLRWVGVRSFRGRRRTPPPSTLAEQP
jgi:hypothetical protein